MYADLTSLPSAILFGHNICSWMEDVQDGGAANLLARYSTQTLVLVLEMLSAS
jgi:hypothetical protein